MTQLLGIGIRGNKALRGEVSPSPRSRGYFRLIPDPLLKVKFQCYCSYLPDCEMYWLSRPEMALVCF